MSFRTNDPGSTGTHASRGTATVKSDGTFTFDESVVNTTQACTPGILRVNGLATVEASAGGSTAITGVSTTAGSAYTGSL
ncbi:MAG TPA: hypothetical protein VN962_19620 [Polyangia bacterium]|nr:hypothetical protein [Polyangia bacterium]